MNGWYLKDIFSWRYFESYKDIKLKFGVDVIVGGRGGRGERKGERIEF